VVEQRAIREIDINPLLVGPDAIVALDARVLLNDPSIPDDQLPPPAIRPYPARYVAPTTLRDGSIVTIRPIRPEDELLMVKFHESLSDRSVYMRYFHMLSLGQRITHERLTRICFVDYDREMVLVAEHGSAEGESEIVAVGRLNRVPGCGEAETAALVTDSYQRRGLGSELLRRLIAFAEDEKIRVLGADTLAENLEMQQVFRNLGFEIHRHADDPSMVRAVLRLRDNMRDQS
jgi:acetyltransferase